MSIRSQVTIALLILSLFSITGCFRAEPERLRIDLPEAESAEELRLIRKALLSEQDLLPEGMLFYHDLDTSLQPEPHLTIRYDPRHLRRQNLYFRLHEMGYSVPGRPGNPEKRLRFLSSALVSE